MPEEAGRVTAVVSAYIAALRRHGIPAEKVYLFGRRGRGDERPDSDIDPIIGGWLSVTETMQEAIRAIEATQLDTLPPG